MGQDVHELRVAILLPSFPPHGGGGVQSSHFNLGRALSSHGAAVEYFTYEDGFLTSEEHGVHRGGLPDIVKRLLRAAISLGFKLLRLSGIAYQFADALGGALSGLLLVRRVRRFRPDIVIAPDHCAPTAFWPSLLPARIVFISHHNSARFLDEPLLGVHVRCDALLALKLEQKAVSKAHMVVCPSEYMREAFRSTYSFGGPVEVVPNLVDTSVLEQVPASDLRRMMGLPETAPVVYIPSANSLYKGAALVFEVIRRIAAGFQGDVGFYLTGRLDEGQRRLLDFLPTNVRYHAPGNIGYQQNIAYVRSCTLCVSPTLIESFGMAALEAQFCGVPTVMFDAGGNRDIVESGQTGYLVPFMDVESLIARALELLSSPLQCTEMASASRQRAQRLFGSSQLVVCYEKLFATLLRSEGDTRAAGTASF
jgi:glycosyltransferase involved in cell wall biosynthesis